MDIHNDTLSINFFKNIFIFLVLVPRSTIFLLETKGTSELNQLKMIINF